MNYMKTEVFLNILISFAISFFRHFMLYAHKIIKMDCMRKKWTKILNVKCNKNPYADLDLE